MNMGTTNMQAKLDGEESTWPQGYTMNYRQLRKDGNKRGDFPQGRAHLLVFQCQSLALRTHPYSMVQTKKNILKNINVYIHTYMYTITIRKK